MREELQNEIIEGYRKELDRYRSILDFLGVTVYNDQEKGFMFTPKTYKCHVEKQAYEELERLRKMKTHCENCGADYLATGIEAGCPCVITAQRDACMGMLKLAHLALGDKRRGFIFAVRQKITALLDEIVAES